MALVAASSTTALAAEQQTAAAAASYSTASTPLGTLMDDPQAKAVLEKHVPQLIANEQIQMARQITLKDIQGFAPQALSDATLAAIDADLAKLKK
jgi:para-nitrobenzyl esterase